MLGLARLSLNNRAFIALVCIATSIIGVFAMTTMRQELIPSIALPQIQVVTTAPGSSSEQVRERISRPVEQAVSGLENVEGTSSTSQANTSIVTIELTYGTDVARSANQVEASLNRIEDQLPESAEPQVIAGGSADLPAVVLSVSSDLEPADLAQRLDANVVEDLERIDGVASVVVVGAPTEVVRITPDADALAERGLTEDDIVTGIDASGLSVPGGAVTDQDRSLDVVVGQSLDSVENLADVVLLPPEGADEGQEGEAQIDPATGQPVAPEPAPVTTLGDVATVERTTEDATSVSRTNGRESLVLLVTAAADGNVVEINDGVDEVLAETLPQLGGDAESAVVFAQAPFIEESIVALAEEGLLGLVMAIGVILLFLRRVRPTIVTAISIPTSLLIAFIGMLVTGYTLNMLTLAALTISIGRVVDDSIVVIENITRHLSYGKQRMRAILDAVGEVAGAITASTLATVVVFLPVALVSGLSGELFRPFALTVAIAMLSSLLVALTIVPVLAYWFLRSPKVPAGADPAEVAAEVREQAEAKEERTLLHRLYAPVLRATVDGVGRRIATLLVSLGLLGGTVLLVPLLTVNFLGDTGQNLASLSQTLPAGTTLQQASDRAAEAEEELLALDGVETVQTTIGGSQFGIGGAPNVVSYSITTDGDADQTALTDTMVATVQDLPDSGDVEAADIASPTGSNSVDIQITGPTPEVRQEATDAILAQLDPLPDSVDELSSDLQADRPTVVVTVDRPAAAELGLTEEAVVGLVARELFPGAIGTITLEDTELDLVITSTDRVDTLTALRELQILPDVPLTDVATLEEEQSRPSITTQDGLETVTISLTPASEDVGTVTTVANDAIDAADLPDGAEATVGGTSADIDETFGQLGLAMVAAVLLIYVLLVWIFKSLVQPLILLVSIPFAATGALGLLVVTGVPLGLPSMIGLLMLAGIVVTNAIVLIDLVNQYRRAGMGLDEALHLGAAKRLRPILMTAAATIFALVPMAFGITGNGGFIAQPLAVVVIGGLISSTLLTLVIVPVLYRVTEGPGERRRLRREERELAEREAADRADAERRARNRSAQAAAAGTGTTGGTTAGSADGSVAGTATDATTTTGGPGDRGTDGTGGRRRASLRERGGIIGILRRRRGR